MKDGNTTEVTWGLSHVDVRPCLVLRLGREACWLAMKPSGAMPSVVMGLCWPQRWVKDACVCEAVRSEDGVWLCWIMFSDSYPNRPGSFEPNRTGLKTKVWLLHFSSIWHSILSCFITCREYLVQHIFLLWCKHKRANLILWRLTVTFATALSRSWRICTVHYLHISVSEVHLRPPPPPEDVVCLTSAVTKVAYNTDSVSEWIITSSSRQWLTWTSTAVPVSCDAFTCHLVVLQMEACGWCALRNINWSMLKGGEALMSRKANITSSILANLKWD